MEEEYKGKYFAYKWRIENFNFCWQKTGEYLESPIFNVESSPETSWKLWLYPRGEEDGEYISCYLFRDDGGPEVMDVDFELSIYVGETLVKLISFEAIYSFRNHQREGLKTFAFRREISCRLAPWEKRFTLTLLCRIFSRNRDRFAIMEPFGRTTIAAEQVSDMNVFDDAADSDPETNKRIEVKTLLEADPFISIIFSHSDDIITIEIHPESCEKIKYSTCQITIIKNREKISEIRHVRSWVGKIETDIYRYSVPHTQTEKDDETNPLKTFFLHYVFSYSLGVEYTTSELNDYGIDLWIENISFLESSCENVKKKKCSDDQALMDNLKAVYASGLYHDLTVKTNCSKFKAHKPILRARCPIFEEKLTATNKVIVIPEYPHGIVQRFFEFLYTDNVEDLHWQVALTLYEMAVQYKVELLIETCRSFLVKNCNAKNASKILYLAVVNKDASLSANIKKYIVEHDEEVFNTDEWLMFAENYWQYAEECMLMKYTRF